MVSVLITRPELSASKTAERLRAAGHEPHILPLAQAKHDPAAALNALRSEPDAVTITSAEAIRVLAALGSGLEPYLGIPIFAVGTATAAAATALGFRNVSTGGGTGAALAALVAESAKGRIVYLAGSPRSGTFEQAFTNHQDRLSVCECYRMLDIRYGNEAVVAFLEEAAPAAILLYSAGSVRRFFALPAVENHPAILSGIRLLCISETAAEAVPEAFRQAVSVAETPEEASLFRLL